MARLCQLIALLVAFFSLSAGSSSSSASASASLASSTTSSPAASAPLSPSPSVTLSPSHSPSPSRSASLSPSASASITSSAVSIVSTFSQSPSVTAALSPSAPATPSPTSTGTWSLMPVGDVCPASGRALPLPVPRLLCYEGSSLPLADTAWSLPGSSPSHEFCIAGFCAAWSVWVNVTAVDPPRTYETPLRTHGFLCNDTAHAAAAVAATNASVPGFLLDLRLCNTPMCNAPSVYTSDACAVSGSLPADAITSSISNEVWLLKVSAVPCAFGIALIVLVLPCVIRDNTPVERKGVTGVRWIWVLISSVLLTLGTFLLVAGTLMPSLGSGASLWDLAPTLTDESSDALFYCNGLWCATGSSSSGSSLLRSSSILRALSSGTVTVYLGSGLTASSAWIMARTASAMRNAGSGPGISLGLTLSIGGLILALSGASTLLMEASSGVFASDTLLRSLAGEAYPARVASAPPPPSFSQWFTYGGWVLPVGFAIVALGSLCALGGIGANNRVGVGGA